MRRDDRPSARARGYTNQWDKAALAYRRANPLCVGCFALGRIVPATVVDHIEPHKGDQVKFWDPTNLQSACDWHHNVIKAKLEQQYASGKLQLGDLKLDSSKAIDLARLVRRRPAAVDEDGWPIG